MHSVLRVTSRKDSTSVPVKHACLNVTIFVGMDALRDGGPISVPRTNRAEREANRRPAQVELTEEEK